MAKPWDFTAIAAKLNSTDRYEQGDAGPDIFDAWYKVAASFAKGTLAGGAATMVACTSDAFRCLLVLDDKTFWASASTDEYVLKSLTGVLQKMTTIFTTKPKFSALAFDAAAGGPEAMRSFGTAALQALQPVAFGAHVLVDKRVEAMTTIRAITELGHFLWRGDRAKFPTIPFAPELSKLVLLACQPSADMLLRDGALATLRIIGSTGGESGARVMSGMVERAQDALVLEPVWAMGATRDTRVVQLIVTRCEAAQRSAAHARFPFDVLTSLYEAVINSRSSTSGATADFRDRAGSAAMLTGAKAAETAAARATDDGGAGGKGGEDSSGKAAGAGAKSSPRALFGPEDEVGLSRILIACDRGAKNVHRDKDSAEGPSERSHELLEALKVLLEDRPDAISLLSVALQPPTVDSVAAVASLADFYSENVWLSLLLPFVNDTLSAMSDALSGSQFDQEVVNLLREGLRVYYLNTDRAPSPELGRALFVGTLNAMAHGYSETERFPTLASLVIKAHLGSGSPAWLREALQDGLTRGRTAVVRSITEMIMSLLGLESSSFGVEAAAAASRHSDVAVHAVLGALADIRTKTSNAIWLSLCLNYGTFVSHQPEAVSRLLASVQAHLHRFISELAAGHDYWFGDELAAAAGVLDAAGGGVDPAVAAARAAEEGSDAARRQARAAAQLEDMVATAEVLRALSLRVTPENAPLLLDLTLKVMAVLPQDRRRTLYSDESLARVLAKIESPDALPPALVQEVLREGGSETRAALAALKPVECLADRDPDVRLAALTALAERPGDFVHSRNADGMRAAIAMLQSLPPDSNDADTSLVEQRLLRYSTASPLRREALEDREHSLVAEGVALGLSESYIFRVAGPTLLQVVRAAAETAARGQRLAAVSAPGGIGVGGAIDGSDLEPGAADAARDFVGVLEAVLGRLLRAARVTAENDPQNNPMPAVVAAMDAIAAQVDQPSLLRFATSPAGLRRLHALEEYSPGWAAAIATWVRDGRLTQAAKETRADRRQRKKSTDAAPWGAARYERVASMEDDPVPLASVGVEMRPVVAPLDNPIPGPGRAPAASVSTARVVTASTVDSPVTAVPAAAARPAAGAVDPGAAELRAMEATAASDALQSLRHSVSYYRLNPAGYEARGMGVHIRDVVLPAVARQWLPEPTKRAEDTPNGVAEFKDADLDRYDAIGAVCRELGSLVGPAADSVLRVRDRMRDLTRACVVREIKRGSADGTGVERARRWMSAHNVHDARLATFIDQYQIASSPVAAGASAAGAAGPSAAADLSFADPSTVRVSLEAVEMTPIPRLAPPPSDVDASRRRRGTPSASGASSSSFKAAEEAEEEDPDLLIVGGGHVRRGPAASAGSVVATGTSVATATATSTSLPPLRAEYLSVGSATATRAAPVTKEQSEAVWAQLQALRRHQEAEGAAARERRTSATIETERIRSESKQRDSAREEAAAKRTAAVAAPAAASATTAAAAAATAPALPEFPEVPTTALPTPPVVREARAKTEAEAKAKAEAEAEAEGGGRVAIAG